ncbi:MAG: ABC transporter substrate-binding protein [Deltaproteobacteria bacterium]|nr:ABC transporter substrate-binding protein [Deltaproteobacteria bacterium]
MQIKLAHSPDADDAFMFYALETGKVPTGDLMIEHVREDIESLNQKAEQGLYHVTALSFHAYPAVADKYALMTVGGSVGDGYGPIVVAAKKMKPHQLKKKLMAIPGKKTTAFLVMRMVEPTIGYVIRPFDKILEIVKEGKAETGLVIHEGQLTYEAMGLFKVIDLGKWWHDETGLPLPLGANAVRKDLPADVQKRLASLIRQSVQYALDHREEAVAYALSFARGLEPEKAGQFIGMYVNHWTLDYGHKGRKSVITLLSRAHEMGLLPESPRIDWVSPEEPDQEETAPEESTEKLPFPNETS